MPVQYLRLLGVSLLVATSLLVAACGGGDNNTSTAARTNWALPGADLQNSRNVGGPINASNVSKLGVAWTVPITAHGAFGAYATTPVAANGVVYTQDLASTSRRSTAKAARCSGRKRTMPSQGPTG